jgi:hypothetical protein
MASGFELDRLALRRRVVVDAGGGGCADEVLAYCESPYRLDGLRAAWPLPEEAHVADWRRYGADGAITFAALQRRLPQLSIPVREGISATDAYRRTMRRGARFDPEIFGGALSLLRPDELLVEIHDHPAGALPVLMPAVRQDFETMYRALACRNEPVPVNPSVSAQMISGIVNWDRVAAYRSAWMAGDGNERNWPDEMRRIAAQAPERFYDRVILIGRGAYSAVPARKMDLDLRDEVWLDRSIGIRLEHEFTHYATKRLYGTMRLNLFDELLADCLGMTYSMGAFRARWFLMALGVLPAIDPQGRAQTYRGSLGDEAFRVVCTILAAAASRAESLVARFYRVETRGRFLLALADSTLEQLAAREGEELFEASWQRARQLERQEFAHGSAAHGKEGRS